MGTFDSHKKEQKAFANRKKRNMEKIRDILKMPLKKRPVVNIYVDPAYLSDIFHGVITGLALHKGEVLLKTDKYDETHTRIRINPISRIEILSPLDQLHSEVILKKQIEKIGKNIREAVDIILS